MTMHVAVASDHGGFLLKERVLEYLVGLGHTVEDLGTTTRPLSTIRILRKRSLMRFSANGWSAPY